jgi:hypothetical protein
MASAAKKLGLPSVLLASQHGESLEDSVGHRSLCALFDKEVLLFSHSSELIVRGEVCSSYGDAMDYLEDFAEDTNHPILRMAKFNLESNEYRGWDNLNTSLKHVDGDIGDTLLLAPSFPRFT